MYVRHNLHPDTCRPAGAVSMTAAHVRNLDPCVRQYLCGVLHAGLPSSFTVTRAHFADAPAHVWDALLLRVPYGCVKDAESHLKGYGGVDTASAALLGSWRAGAIIKGRPYAGGNDLSVRVSRHIIYIEGEPCSKTCQSKKSTRSNSAAPAET